MFTRQAIEICMIPTGCFMWSCTVSLTVNFQCRHNKGTISRFLGQIMQDRGATRGAAAAAEGAPEDTRSIA